jgi:hypothetical protein
VTTVGVAAVASFEMIGRGEDEVRAFIIKIFRSERRRGVFGRFWLGGLERLWHL